MYDTDKDYWDLVDDMRSEDYTKYSNEDIKRMYDTATLHIHGWITSQDGSYERAIYESGYDLMKAEMKRRGLKL